MKKDLRVLPKGKKLKDKYYIGFYDGELLIAVMDLIFRYPNAETVFIGFFMTDKCVQMKGVGTSIITETCVYLKK